MYKVALFDADNTLFDFNSAERAAFSITMREFGAPCTDSVFESYSEGNRLLWLQLEKGTITREALQLKRFEGFVQSAPVKEVNASYRKHLSEQGMLMPHALEVCAALRGRAGIYIATNGLTAVQKNRISRSVLAPYIDGVFISEEMGYAKPDIRFFEHILSRIGNPEPREVLIVGDSLTSDIRGGMNASLSCCWYNTAGEAPPAGYSIDHIVRDLREVLELF